MRKNIVPNGEVLDEPRPGERHFGEYLEGLIGGHRRTVLVLGSASMAWISF